MLKKKKLIRICITIKIKIKVHTKHPAQNLKNNIKSIDITNDPTKTSKTNYHASFRSAMYY